MPSENVIETDVLVVGGGLAGIFAAVKAREEGVDVVIAEKGYVGRSSAALAANNTSIFNPQWGHNLKDWMTQIAETGDYMNNPEMTEVTLKESYDRYQDLVSWGIQFPKGKDGELIALPPHGVLQDYYTDRGTKWVPALRKPAVNSGAKIMDRIMITDLMTQEGRVVGAVGFHIRTGDFYVFKAKATVVCTGGGTLSSPYDGEAIAYRSGADISGKEFSISGTGPFSYMGTGYGYYGDRKDKTRESLEDKEIKKLPRFGASMFIDKYLDSEGNKVNRYTMTSAAHIGRAPFFWNLDDATQEEIDLTAMSGGSMDVTRGLYQVPVNFGGYVGWAVHCAAGISSTDTKGGTSLPGLYAAGDGYNSRAIGAKYAHRGFGTRNAMVIGTRAGRSAAEYAKKTSEKISTDPEELARLKKSIYLPLERKSGFDQDWIALQLRTITYPYYVWFIRHGDRLKAALTMVDFVKNHVTPMMYAKPKDTHGLRLAHETIGRVLSFEMMLRAALFRTESRGVHYREDYPFRDDPNWLAEVRIRQKDGEMELVKEPFPRKWWPDLSKPYRERYPLEYLGEESMRGKE